MADNERELTLQPPADRKRRRHQVALVRILEQVCDDLRVRLGGEAVPSAFERGREFSEVLDDPVQTDRELATARQKRMRVLERDPAVRRPTRVPDPTESGRNHARETTLQLHELSDRTDTTDQASAAVALDQAETSRVVAAIVQTRQRVQQQGLRAARPNISRNTADCCPPLPFLLPRSPRNGASHSRFLR